MQLNSITLATIKRLNENTVKDDGVFLADVPQGIAFIWSGRCWMRMGHSEDVWPVHKKGGHVEGLNVTLAPLGHTEGWLWCVSLETGNAQRVSPSAAVRVIPDAEVRLG